MRGKLEELTTWIKEHWQDFLREACEDEGTLIGLPHPFIVPNERVFDELYYWDTYFTNIGLIRQGFVEWALGNVENFFYLIERFGFVPNGNRTYYLSRSQPPFLSSMVVDIYEEKREKWWLERAYTYIMNEYYGFWMKGPHMTELGLNRYYDKGLPEGVEDPSNLPPHLATEAESGWDFTPRFSDARNCLPIDLNCLLYKYEQDLGYISQLLGQHRKAREFYQAAQRRRELVVKYMWDDESGLFYDYDFVKGEKRPVKSLAAYSALWSGLASNYEAGRLRDNLKLFEHEWGLATCDEDYGEENKQWNYPNGWAPLHFIVVQGLIRYGYWKEAVRIAGKWLSLVLKIYEETGKLWERYNVVEGSLNAPGRYEVNTMFGWTAGVTVAFAELFALPCGQEV